MDPSRLMEPGSLERRRARPGKVSTNLTDIGRTIYLGVGTGSAEPSGDDSDDGDGDVEDHVPADDVPADGENEDGEPGGSESADEEAEGDAGDEDGTGFGILIAVVAIAEVAIAGIAIGPRSQIARNYRRWMPEPVGQGAINSSPWSVRTPWP